MVKEWSFAGDIVEGIWLLVNQDKIFEANIGSGEGHSIEEWIKLSFEIIQKNYKDYIIQNNHFVSNYKVLVSDNSLIKKVGYKNVTSIEELCKMMLN